METRFKLMAIHQTDKWSDFSRYNYNHDATRPSLVGTAVEDCHIFGIYMFQSKEQTTDLDKKVNIELADLNFIDRSGNIVDLGSIDLKEKNHISNFVNFVVSLDAENTKYVPHKIIKDCDSRFLSSEFDVYDSVFSDFGFNFNIKSEEEIHDIVWEKAYEIVHRKYNKTLFIPVVHDYGVWRDWQREQAPKIIPTLPLFAYQAGNVLSFIKPDIGSELESYNQP